MKEILKLPQQFWSVFSSRNRYIYMEAMLTIYDEYLYNDYFLTKETCIQLIAEHFSDRIVDISADDEDQEADLMEPMASKILNRLIRFTWLKKVEDYSSFKTNIIIPDYSSLFIETIKRLNNPDSDEKDLYIQNVYTNIYSFYYDMKAGLELLKAAMINTARLNRSLQDMLHNMDQFFGALLEKNNYEDLLLEHLNVYVETIVNKKYSLIKTSDNFYIYKNDIKKLLRAIGEDENRLSILKHKMLAEGKKEEDIENEFADTLYEIERGMINMEKRISHIDTEHSKYIRATVSRLEYLLSSDDSLKGNVVALLNLMSRRKDNDLSAQVTNTIQINDPTVISSDSLYKKRGKRKQFEETVEAEVETEEELSREDILRINRNKNRYSKAQIEEFIIDKMEDGIFRTKDHAIQSDEEFELLILAYDYSIRKSSPFHVVPGVKGTITNGKYSYPDMIFEKNSLD
ncbi:MAG TPA: Wadjet anti-phage system protein JetA family protein [Mobilitalea sp.]|nr:Wadjet anti-phage system protein JetA family protein [Mobilitalea sp.]